MILLGIGVAAIPIECNVVNLIRLCGIFIEVQFSSQAFRMFRDLKSLFDFHCSVGAQKNLCLDQIFFQISARQRKLHSGMVSQVNLLQLDDLNQIVLRMLRFRWFRFRCRILHHFDDFNKLIGKVLLSLADTERYFVTF
ncbi:hypothetical protein SDC9_113954 [bioreactor metagenome]|uniref:Uncharacterized protein n=1 Tax=bioreactor metagenome TaxID=1076179 RepID=A0A645BPI5_9ZZZZ